MSDRCGFVDPARQRRFEERGYEVVPLLDADDRARLRAVYESSGTVAGEGFTASLRGHTLAENVALAERIGEVVLPRLAPVLEGYDAIGSTFLVKGAGESGAMDLHQDWCSVDERAHHAINVWCALDDVPPEAGPLEVIPGSHLWFTTYRAPTIESVRVEFGPDVDGAVETLQVRAGDAVIYDQRILHGSRENTSGSARVVAQIGMVPTGVPLVMCFVAEGGEIELREVDRYAFFEGFAYEDHVRLDRPGTRVATTDEPPLTPAEVLLRIGALSSD